MSLTKDQRKALPDSDFAVPELRKMPIHDVTHVRLAWDMVDRTQGLTGEQRKTARDRIIKRADDLAVDTEDWDKLVSAASVTLSALSAMALDMPEVEDHPNRMPFSGVLAFVDQPSDVAPGGSGGKRTYLPSDVAEKMLPSLLGMGVDYTPKFDGHDAQKKVGIISGAEIVDSELRISGFFYAGDFPQVCARIKSEKEALGFSYEIKAQTLPMPGGLLQIVGGNFTGAAVLYKAKAAYQNTSLAANADTKDLDMTPEELKAILAEAINPVAASVKELATKVTTIEASQLQASKAHDLVRPHSEKLRDCAASMEAAGIGGHVDRGHVKVLRHMADQMEAEGVMGKVPHIYRDHDFFTASADKGADKNADVVGAQIAAAVDAAVKPLQAELAASATKVADLSAKAFTQAGAPDRKTVPSDVTKLLAKYELSAGAEAGTLTVAQIDKTLAAAGLSTQQRLAAKVQMINAGVLKA